MESKDAILELDWILNNGFKADSNLPGTDNCKEALKKGIDALYKVATARIEEHSDAVGNYYCKCSNCGNSWWNKYTEKYCSNCGAKIEED